MNNLQFKLIEEFVFFTDCLLLRSFNIYFFSKPKQFLQIKKDERKMNEDVSKWMKKVILKKIYLQGL